MSGGRRRSEVGSREKPRSSSTQITRGEGRWTTALVLFAYLPPEEEESSLVLRLHFVVIVTASTVTTFVSLWMLVQSPNPGSIPRSEKAAQGLTCSFHLPRENCIRHKYGHSLGTVMLKGPCVLEAAHNTQLSPGFPRERMERWGFSKASSPQDSIMGHSHSCLSPNATEVTGTQGNRSSSLQLTEQTLSLSWPNQRTSTSILSYRYEDGGCWYRNSASHRRHLPGCLCGGFGQDP